MLSKEWKHLLLIIVIFIAACIETDIYLPAFTDMMSFFAISEETIQGLLTWNFIGICFSGPLYGPISDALGRKRPLMVGLGLFLLGSILTLASESFAWMLFGRALQGLGSGGCFTLGTAIIFDVFKEKQAISALNKLNSIVPFIIALAPMLGGYLNYTFGFRANFLAIAFCVLVSFIISGLFFNETLPQEKRVPLDMKKIGRDFKKVCLSLPFWQTSMIVSLIFAGYLVFLSCISVLFILELGVSKHAMPIYQGALLGAWLVGNLTCRRSIDILGIPKIKIFGSILSAAAGIALLMGAWLAPQNPYLPTAAMMVYAFGTNWINGIYFPEGMEIFPDIKGMTASLLTSARLLTTALIVGLASRLYDGTIYPLIAILCTIIATIILTMFFYEKNSAKAPAIADPHMLHL